MAAKPPKTPDHVSAALTYQAARFGADWDKALMVQIMRKGLAPGRKLWGRSPRIDPFLGPEALALDDDFFKARYGVFNDAAGLEITLYEAGSLHPIGRPRGRVTGRREGMPVLVSANCMARDRETRIRLRLMDNSMVADEPYLQVRREGTSQVRDRLTDQLSTSLGLWGDFVIAACKWGAKVEDVQEFLQQDVVPVVSEIAARRLARHPRDRRADTMLRVTLEIMAGILPEEASQPLKSVAF